MVLGMVSGQKLSSLNIWPKIQTISLQTCTVQWNWGAATPDQASELVNDEKSDAVRQQLMKDLKFPSNCRQDRVTALKSAEEMSAY